MQGGGRGRGVQQNLGSRALGAAGISGEQGVSQRHQSTGVWMCLCVLLCVHACVCVGLCACVHSCVLICLHTRVCVGFCTCVYACMHLSVRTSILVHMCPQMCPCMPVHACTHACMSVCSHMCMCVHMCPRAPTCIHMRACIYVCAYTCACVCMCAHMYTCVCMHVCAYMCACVCMCEKPPQNLLAPSGPGSSRIPGDTVESAECVHRLGRVSVDEGQCVCGAGQCESVRRRVVTPPGWGRWGEEAAPTLSCRCGLCPVGRGEAAQRLWAAKQTERDCAPQPARLPFLRFLSRSEAASPASSDRVRVAALCSQNVGGPWGQCGPHSAPCHPGPPVPPSWGPD